MAFEDELYAANFRLNRAELSLRRLHLDSMPLYLTVALGTACNINCPYCYQIRSDENLLEPKPFGAGLRGEVAAFYPFLSTLRVMGGEVFIIPGFEEFVDEAAALVNRPIISISTNGTLINERWAEKIVGIPFQEVTVSIDGATPETYARLRKGASLGKVLANVDRIQKLKEQHKTRFPDVNFFYLVMQSTYREIPSFLQTAQDHGIKQVSFQIPVIDQRNLSKDPGLASEIEFSEGQVKELHNLTRRSIEERRREFRCINFSGLHSLFQKHNLDTDFLAEERYSIYPGDNEENKQSVDKPAVDAGTKQIESANETACNQIRLCPNPWTLMYVTEYGDVLLCSGAPPVGNFYETPLINLWNSPKAIALRSNIIEGRYESAGCAKQWCSWRERKKSDQPERIAIKDLITEFRRLTREAVGKQETRAQPPGDDLMPKSVRRMLTERNQRIAELEAQFFMLCEKNAEMLQAAGNQIQPPALRRPSGDDVQLLSEVRFGKSYFLKLLKKALIGTAIRSIQLLERTTRVLKRFVNWVCRL